jgi:hypothetical protein
MDADALLARSEALVRRAGEIMDRLRVRERLGRLGRVALVGSVRHGLMSTPNIDFEVYTKLPDAAAGASVMAEMAAEPGVTGLAHHDFMATEDPGLYWRLDLLDADGAAWDFDIWLVPLDHPHAGMAEAFAEALTGALARDTRAAILRLKAELGARAQLEGKARPRGIDICRAVLDGGVRDVAGFDAWRAQNPPPDMETWRPGS